jgi:hypothetical protein
MKFWTEDRMKMFFIVEMDHDAAERLDVQEYCNEIQSAIWERWADRPRESIKVTHPYKKPPERDPDSGRVLPPEPLA